jgi:transposase
MSEITSQTIIIGVDTHKLVHAAVAISGLGARLGEKTIPVSVRGYHELEAWARSLKPPKATQPGRGFLRPGCG